MWQVFGRIGEGVPAWLDFLDAARVALADGNGRGAVLESHSALDAFLSVHQSNRLRARGIASTAAEWMVGRSIRVEDRFGSLLEASDGFELRRKYQRLWTVLRRAIGFEIGWSIVRTSPWRTQSRANL